MQPTQFASVLIILIVVIYTCDSRTIKLCSTGGCRDRCDRCSWGVTYNEDCDYEECAKGPSHPCTRDRQCGDGLHCLCDRCSGCSAIDVDACYAPSCPLIVNRNMRAYQ